MIYVSEITGKQYRSEADCLADEEKYLEAKKAEEEQKAEAAKQRKDRAAAVDKAYKEYQEARQNYTEVLSDFCKEYGAYHTSIKPVDIQEIYDLFSIF